MALRHEKHLALIACVLVMFGSTSATLLPALGDTPSGNFTVDFKQGNISLYTELFKAPKTADEVLEGLTLYGGYSGKLVDTLEPDFRLLGWDKLSANHSYEFILHESTGGCACDAKLFTRK